MNKVQSKERNCNVRQNTEINKYINGSKLIWMNLQTVRLCITCIFHKFLIPNLKMEKINKEEILKIQEEVHTGGEMVNCLWQE